MRIGRRPGRTALVMAAGLMLGSGAAMAQEVQGVWQRTDTGASRVRIGPCGGALCGTVVWLKNPNGAGKVGERVFYNMVPAGPGKWSGNAFNPEDGKTYSGSMTLSGNALTTSGCILGGLICRSVSWARVN